MSSRVSSASLESAPLTWRERAVGSGLYGLSQLLRRTAHFQVDGWEHLHQAQAQERGIIFVAWHGMTMMLASFFQNHLDLGRLAIILPDDWRGATLSVWTRKLGATPFRLHLEGDAGMASARKLAEVVRHLKAGRDCYITPDGPDGPAYVVKPGATFLSRKGRACLLPLGAYTRSGYRLKRWDQYVVPRPFCRISIAVGEPIEVSAESNLSALDEHLTNQLHRVAAQAAANYYKKQPASKTDSMQGVEP